MDVIGHLLTTVKELSGQLGATTGVLAITAAVFIVLYNWQIWDRHLWPPGPMPLPFLGNILWIARSKELWKDVLALQKIYGEVMTLHFPLGKRWVVLNSPEAIRQGFIKNADYLSERPPSHKGLIFNYKEPPGVWKPRRKYMLTVLRQHGLGGDGMDAAIHNELSHFIAALHLEVGKPLDLADLLPKATCNVITTVLFRQRFDYDDDEMDSVQFANFLAMNIKARVLPFITYLPSYKKEKAIVDNGIKYLENLISKHRKEMEEGYVTEDFIHSFMKEQQKHGTSADIGFSDIDLLRGVMTLYIAGTETTANSLYWSFLYLVMYPDIQQKMRNEIRQTIGVRPVKYSDREVLPYTMSVLMEVTRHVLVGDSTMPHLASQDVIVCGVRIPKGAHVVSNHFTTCWNPVKYPEPEKFDPERFLDSEGKYCKPENYYWTPFGTGRRICLGQQLAQTELFIFAVTILQNFQIVLGQEEKPSLQPKVKKLVKSPENNYLVKLVTGK